MAPLVIKICGITNLLDAEAAVAAGASALGFNFYHRSKRYIEPEDAAAIVSRLPAGVLKVGVFVNEGPAQVAAIASTVRLDVAQLHGDETPADIPAGLRVWKAFRVEPGFDLAAIADFDVEAVLLDGPAGSEYGGTGQPFAWSLARQCSKPVVIAGGLDPTNVGQALAESHAWGVDACSKLESAPGRKDHHKMIQFIQAARAAQGQS